MKLREEESQGREEERQGREKESQGREKERQGREEPQEEHEDLEPKEVGSPLLSSLAEEKILKQAEEQERERERAFAPSLAVTDSPFVPSAPSAPIENDSHLHSPNCE